MQTIYFILKTQKENNLSANVKRNYPDPMYTVYVSGTCTSKISNNSISKQPCKLFLSFRLNVAIVFSSITVACDVGGFPITALRRVFTGFNGKLGIIERYWQTKWIEFTRLYWESYQRYSVAVTMFTSLQQGNITRIRWEWLK